MRKARYAGSRLPASIWAAAALGIGIGAGYLFFAGIATAELLLFVAAVLPWFERRIVRSVSRAYTITTHIDPDRTARLAGHVSAVWPTGTLRQPEQTRWNSCRRFGT